MKLIVALLMLVPTMLAAQSAIPKAVSETVNLSPRCKKGDLQRYEVKRELRKLNPDGSQRTHRHDVFAFTQYCRSNTPENGLEYSITVDSFAVGINLRMDEDLRPLDRVPQFDGRSMSSKINRIFPVKNGCYDVETNFLDTMKYVEAYDFREQYLYLRLLEQLRFSAGPKLSKVGDTVTIVLPDLCLKISQVVNSYKLASASHVLELTGLGKYGNRPTALIAIRPSKSSVTVSIWAGDSYSYEGAGTIELSGNFVVALDDGDIVSAEITERSDVNLVHPDKSENMNSAIKVLNLRQLN
ncbi:MAG: hypothetical protein WBP29_06495 [Candidatus Zixiibacteriota bacterium]